MTKQQFLFAACIASQALAAQLRILQADEEEEIIDPDNAGETSIYEGLVWKDLTGGIGTGTAWVILFAFVGLILCLFKNCSKCPNLIVCLGFMLPLIAYGFIR